MGHKIRWSIFKLMIWFPVKKPQAAPITERDRRGESNSRTKRSPKWSSLYAQPWILHIKAHASFWTPVFYVLVLKESLEISLAHSWLKDKRTQSTNTNTWEIASLRPIYLFLNTFCLFAYLSISPKARTVSF